MELQFGLERNQPQFCFLISFSLYLLMLPLHIKYSTEGMEKYTLLKNKNTGTNMNNISGEHNRVHLKIDSV